MVVRRVREEYIDEPDVVEVVPATRRRVVTERRVGGGYGYGGPAFGNPVALVALGLIVVLLLFLFFGIR